MIDQIFLGRRKCAVARAIFKSGAGNITVNGRQLDVFFNQRDNREDVLLPLNLTETAGQYDIAVRVSGGGTTGQSQAIRLAIAKALIDINPDFRARLKPLGLLTRDPRMVERKKYGRPKARKRFQFSKR
jgi:small subunit ribosomal protein S9